MSTNDNQADAVFAAALEANDVDALAAECERRLRALGEGSSLHFRTGEGKPSAWRMPPRPMIGGVVGVPDWSRWAREAARALIAARKAEAAAAWGAQPARMQEKVAGRKAP